ncbi:putative ABI family protein [Medicago truncatula]|uniref:ABIL1-like protein n=1 Tax=Medicago truncatula TaxID=3880 RepID=B7FL53_MEDTR|nr:probable protein ABIL5 [Medicago truncatula]ACJ85487.1 unknown [Medicago truncatula]AES76823.1 ABIL1-like protein [Medicago truncatula]AFK43534.1 unknown [Medicago truncatula]RHN52925.1 putative ABI family protein [Medicago truncatula]
MDVNFKSLSFEKSEAEPEVEENMHFLKSLQELRELRSQLHYAADYCETTFMESEKKRDVMDDTKEYICRAMVTVVDHLGNVSSNLEGLISHKNSFSDAEIRIQCLTQRLFTCDQYADKVALSNMQWREKLPRLHTRYLSSPPILERSKSDKLSNSKSEVPLKKEDKHIQGDLPLYMYTQNPCTTKNLKPATATVSKHNNLAFVMPVRDGLSVLAKVSNPAFDFHGTPKVTPRHRRSLHGSDILYLIKRSKRKH